MFFRPVEYGIGSSDNSFFGGGIKIKLPKKVLLYQHFILDEFYLVNSKIEMVGGEINMDIKLDLEHLIYLGLMACTL